MERNYQNDQIQTVGCFRTQHPSGSTSNLGIEASVGFQRTGTTVSVPNSWVNGVIRIVQSAVGVVSAWSTESEDEAQKNEEVSKLLDCFAPDLNDSIVAGCFTEGERERLAKKQPEVKPDLLDGSFVLVDSVPDQRRDLRIEIGLFDPVQREKDEKEAQSIMLQHSFVPGFNFGVAPRPLSEKVPSP